MPDKVEEVLWDLVEGLSNLVEDSVAEILSSLVEVILVGTTVSLFVNLNKLEVSISKAVIEKTYLLYSKRKSNP